MCKHITHNQAVISELLVRLRKSPVAYRHVLSLVDAEFHDHVSTPNEWRLFRAESVLFLTSIYENPDQPGEELADVLVWDEPDDAGAQGLIRFLENNRGWISQVAVLGVAAFGRLRPRLTDGAWRLSRNYGLTHQDFKSRPSDLVRRLVPVDRPHIEKAAEAYEGARHHSTMRDFAAMAAGRPVRCWGAFTDGGLAGFVSTNPICAGVTEISWIFTAEAFRRRGIAAGLLTAACEEALGLGDMVGYHAGGTGDDLDRMVRSTGFIETLPTYRFIPASSKVQWLTHWGQHV